MIKIGPALRAYIEERNRVYGKYWPDQVVDLATVTDADLKKLADRVANDLSPENLCCDGELRGAPLRAKTKKLYAVKRDLEALGVTHAWW